MVTKKRPTRATRTREETQDDFEEISNKSRNRVPTDAKSASASKTRKDSIRQAVEGLSVEKAVQAISGVNLEVSRTFSNVQQQVVEKVQELENINEAIKIEREELERLHGVDIIASTIDDLVAQHDAKEKELQEFDAQSTKLRAEVAKELDKTRQRDQAEYEYNLKLARKKVADEFAEEDRVQQGKNRDRQELLEKGWAEREEIHKGREAEFAQYKAKVEAFPAELKAEVDKNVAIATSSLKRNLEFESKLAAQEANSKNALLQQQIASLEAAKTAQQATIAELQSQLAQAQSQVATIAKQALESASGQQALERITSLASRDNGTIPQRQKS